MTIKQFTILSCIATICCILISFTQETPSLSKKDLMGKNSPTLFKNEYKLQYDTYKAFTKMKASAAKEGIDIKIVSSYRNYDRQNNIWTRKYKKFTAEGLSPIQAIRKIIEYSTIPGTSRHHWGTDIDIVDANAKQPKGLLLEENFHNNGPFCKLKEWLDQHANTFGFFMVYTDITDRKGFKYEPWHYSYAPVSIPMLRAYEKLDIKKELKNANLIGIEHFTEDFINQYIKENILDINPKLH